MLPDVVGVVFAAVGENPRFLSEVRKTGGWEMNWKSEAIERLSRYTAMTRAMENIPLELVRLKQDAVKLRGCRPDRLPTGSTPGPGDDALLCNLGSKLSHLQAIYGSEK